MEIISRSEAKEKGLKRYFTGKPCKKGHVSERYVSTAICCECVRITRLKQRKSKREEYRRLAHEYRERNLEKARQCTRNHYYKNRDHYIEYSKEYYQHNKDDRLKTMNVWRHNNKHRHTTYTKRFKKHGQQSIKYWGYKESMEQIYQESTRLRELLDVDFVVDHIIPLNSDTVCGLHCWHNLQILTREENTRKGNDYQQDW